MPVPKQYVTQGCSPLHACVLFMFNQLKEKYHVCGLVNLYNSTKFCHFAFSGKNKIMLHGVMRKSSRGLPKSVIQEEIKNTKEQAKVRGTTKAAVLEGDPECPDLVAFSVYDTKPVHFLSMACTSLKWTEKEKRVFDNDAGINVMMRFLCAEVNDDYNNGMNDVNVAN